MPSLWYVAAAYGAIWVVLFIYLLTLHQRVAALRQRLEATQRRTEPGTSRQPARARTPEKAVSQMEQG